MNAIQCIFLVFPSTGSHESEVWMRDKVDYLIYMVLTRNGLGLNWVPIVMDSQESLSLTTKCLSVVNSFK